MVRITSNDGDNTLDSGRKQNVEFHLSSQIHAGAMDGCGMIPGGEGKLDVDQLAHPPQLLDADECVVIHLFFCF